MEGIDHMITKVLMLASETCKPCAALKPVLIEACDKAETELSIVHITKDSPEVAKYGVRSVPTVILFDQDKEVARFTGALSRDDLFTLLRVAV